MTTDEYTPEQVTEECAQDLTEFGLDQVTYDDIVHGWKHAFRGRDQMIQAIDVAATKVPRPT